MQKEGYSAAVTLSVLVGGRTIPLGSIGPDFMILSPPAALPGTGGEILATVDGKPRRWAATWPASDEVRREVGITCMRD